MSVWLRGGFNSVYLDTDLGRDLYQLSNLWIGQHAIWLGPQLSLGLPASPLYYYLFYPALVIGRGQANSLLIMNLLIAAFALAVFSWHAYSRWGLSSIPGILSLGISSWWIQFVLHPGNGFTYVYFLFLSLTALWFDLPLFFSAFFLGISISFHPAAIVALPILIYEWFRRRRSFYSLVLIICLLILPWLPIILFEIITHNFLLRQWLTQPSLGLIHFKPNLINLSRVFFIFSLPPILSATIAIILFIKSSLRIRTWLLLITLSLICFVGISPLPPHYLLGISCLLTFTLIIALQNLSPNNYKLLVALSLLFVYQFFRLPAPIPANRTIQKISNVVNQYLLNNPLNTNNKIAVVASLGPGNLSPQADDYRFFLRIRGYQVLDVVNYDQANTLLMFIETPNFDWPQWSTWETNRFGDKTFVSEFDATDIKIITFTKQ